MNQLVLKGLAFTNIFASQGIYYTKQHLLLMKWTDVYEALVKNLLLSAPDTKVKKQTDYGLIELEVHLIQVQPICR